MLYFSKIKLIAIYTIIFFLSLFALTNFFDNQENIFLSKKIKLGLDLQGGSYLLLEVDAKPLVNQKLQQKDGSIIIPEVLRPYMNNKIQIG